MRIGYKAYNNTIQQIKPRYDNRNIDNEGGKIQGKSEQNYRQHFKNIDGSIIQSNGMDILQLSKETVEALKKAQSNKTDALQLSKEGVETLQKSQNTED